MAKKIVTSTNKKAVAIASPIYIDNGFDESDFEYDFSIKYKLVGDNLINGKIINMVRYLFCDKTIVERDELLISDLLGDYHLGQSGTDIEVYAECLVHLINIGEIKVIRPEELR